MRVLKRSCPDFSVQNRGTQKDWSGQEVGGAACGPWQRARYSIPSQPPPHCDAHLPLPPTSDLPWSSWSWQPRPSLFALRLFSYCFTAIWIWVAKANVGCVLGPLRWGWHLLYSTDPSPRQLLSASKLSFTQLLCCALECCLQTLAILACFWVSAPVPWPAITSLPTCTVVLGGKQQGKAQSG